MLTWKQVTGLVMVLGLISYIIYDIVAYERGGNISTISRTCLNLATDFPFFMICFCLLVGIAIGHLFLPQHVSP